MGEFVLLGGWLRGPQPEAVAEAIAIEEPTALVDDSAPQDELIDDACAHVRRFRAMLADAFDYVQSRGEPAAPLRIRVHPVALAKAEAIGLPLAADTALEESEAMIELHCGSIDARLCVPLGRLLAEMPQQ